MPDVISARRPPGFGVCLPHGWRDDLPVAAPEQQWNFIRDQALRVETLGFDSVWFVDHLQPVVDPRGPYFECWTAMAALAASTSRVRLGQMATCNAYRPPALLAKMAAGIDAMSDGRLDLGLGAGWFEAEHIAWGYDFPAAKVRIDRLEEAVAVILRLWASGADAPASYEGAHYRLDRVTMAPRPVQEPHPPLWIAGSGERRTLALVARHGDWCNFNGPAANVARKAEILADHCRRVGRDPTEIGISWKGDVVIAADERRVHAQVDRIRQQWLARGIAQFADDAGFRAGHLVGTPDEVRARIAEYQRAGCDYFICDFWNLDDDSLELFAAEVVGRSAPARSG
jgi:F420-dependent oxidoreductase-like protein